MPLSENQRQKIANLLSQKIENKLEKYGKETTSMPFLARLIQDSEKIAAYSFIHSMATTLGMSVYEEVSEIIAVENSEKAHKKYGMGGVISPQQNAVIKGIITELRNGSRTADIEKEKAEVLQASTKGGEFHKSGQIADFFMQRNGEEHYFEIKTVKPNIDVFEKSKTKLLEWVARKGAPVNVYLAFPYNPYHPEPYQRFTQVGMMQPRSDFLVGDEYWDFIGGENTFSELLSIFDSVGKSYKQRLDDKFSAIARQKIDYS